MSLNLKKTNQKTEQATVRTRSVLSEDEAQLFPNSITIQVAGLSARYPQGPEDLALAVAAR
jgi:hypothetical protein